MVEPLPTDRRVGDSMTKRTFGKLQLNRETLRNLSTGELEKVAGGVTYITCREGCSEGCPPSDYPAVCTQYGCSEGDTCFTCICSAEPAATCFDC